jgi:CHAT domain-containing protein
MALAQMRGACEALTTLWPVADARTGSFIRHVYRPRQGT